MRTLSVVDPSTREPFAEVQATDAAAVDAAVQAVLAAEARVLRTFGSADEVAALREGRPQPAPGTVDAEGS